MAITNQQRVGVALDLLQAGLAPYVEREFVSMYKERALNEARRLLPPEDRLNTGRPSRDSKTVRHRCMRTREVRVVTAAFGVK